MSAPQPPPGHILTPAVAWVWTEFLLAYEQLMLPPGTVRTIERGCCTIAQKRNALVRAFLKRKELKWALFLDSDMLPAPDMIYRLLRWDVGIVSGLYSASAGPRSLSAAAGAPRTAPSGRSPSSAAPSRSSASIGPARDVCSSGGTSWRRSPNHGSRRTLRTSVRIPPSARRPQRPGSRSTATPRPGWATSGCRATTWSTSSRWERAPRPGARYGLRGATEAVRRPGRASKK